MPERPLSAVVLAAGEGTRMRSTRPKPLHMLCGRAMVLYVLDALKDCEVDKAVVVVGRGGDRGPNGPQEEAGGLLLDFRGQHVHVGQVAPTGVGLTPFPD